MREELTILQEDERQAMLLDRAAVLRVVSALRRYRAAASELLRSRYQDGECDAAALCSFELEIGEIEESGKTEGF